MNKDLSRRVKPVTPVCWVRGVVVHDIQQLLKIIEVFDKKAQLWQYRQKKRENIEKSETGEDNGNENEEEKAMEDSTEQEQKEPLQVGAASGCGLGMCVYI